MSRLKRTQADTSSRASAAIQSIWERSARPRRHALGTCALVGRLPSFRPTAGKSTRKFTYWSDDWPDVVCWSTASRIHETMKTMLSSNRRLPITGRERRRSAIQMFSSCHGLRTCADAETIWCWNRRAREHCSESAIRRSRPRSPPCPPRNKSKGSVDRTGFRGSSFSPCWSIARSFSR